MLGGRGSGDKLRTVLYDRKLNQLSFGAKSPMELHHFQAVVWRDSIIVVGMALTGVYPDETPVPNLYLYHVKTDTWELKSSIPSGRRRGSAQAVIVGDWVYFFNGLTNGHKSGWTEKTDRYNLVTNTWQTLPNSPHQRDHSVALLHDNNVYIVGGRKSNTGGTGGLHAFPVNQIDVFNLSNNTWSTLPTSANLQEMRGGPMAAIQPNSEGHQQINVWGGEYGGGTRNTGKGLDLTTNTWISLPNLPSTLHAAQIVQVSPDSLVMIAGSLSGGNELDVSNSNYVKRYESAPLVFPVSWVSVEGDWDAETRTAQLRWEVNEEQVQKFDVLRRTDGSTIPTLLDQISSRGDGLSTYEFSDRLPPESSVLQYEIRAVDYDGSVSYSPVINLIIEAEPIEVYPTRLTSTQRTVQIRGAQPSSVAVYGLDGRLVWSALLAQNEWNIPQDIPAATYLLRLTLDHGQSYTTRIMLE
ncbi:MAG: T9SS type A sorting domain-containing protein [Bacteroidia bacterium]|nr:T9SS type A sorting domain-containing protein [Bacteroidia bacterium]